MIEDTPDYETYRGEKAVAHSTIFFLFCPLITSFDHHDQILSKKLR